MRNELLETRFLKGLPGKPLSFPLKKTKTQGPQNTRTTHSLKGNVHPHGHRRLRGTRVSAFFLQAFGDSRAARTPAGAPAREAGSRRGGVRGAQSQAGRAGRGAGVRGAGRDGPRPAARPTPSRGAAPAPPRPPPGPRALLAAVPSWAGDVSGRPAAPSRRPGRPVPSGLQRGPGPGALGAPAASRGAHSLTALAPPGASPARVPRPRHAPQRRGGPRRRLLGRGGRLGAPGLDPRAGLWGPGQEFPDRELAARGGRPAARTAAAPGPAGRPGSPPAVPRGRARARRRGALRPAVGGAGAQPVGGRRGAAGPGSGGPRLRLPAFGPR